MLNKRNTNLQNGCSTSREQISPTAKPPITSPSVWCWRMIRAVPNTPAMRMNMHNQPTGLYPNRALKATSPPIMAPAPAMCSLSFHFRLTITQIIIMMRAANNSCHIPGDIQPVHHEQAEDVRGNGQDERYIPSFPLYQIAGAKSVDLTEKEDGQGRHKDCKAVHHSQYD